MSEKVEEPKYGKLPEFSGCPYMDGCKHKNADWGDTCGACMYFERQIYKLTELVDHLMGVICWHETNLVFAGNPKELIKENQRLLKKTKRLLGGCGYHRNKELLEKK